MGGNFSGSLKIKKIIKINNLNTNYIAEIKTILQQVRQKAYAAVHAEMVWAYWQIGKRIVEEEQHGEQRAQYGQQIIQTLSDELTHEFGRGFGEKNLREIRRFYIEFQDVEKWKTLFSKLSWSHFHRVLKVQNEQARTYLSARSGGKWLVGAHIGSQYQHFVLRPFACQPAA